MCVHLWSGVSPEFAEGDHHADAADAAADIYIMMQCLFVCHEK